MDITRTQFLEYLSTYTQKLRVYLRSSVRHLLPPPGPSRPRQPTSHTQKKVERLEAFEANIQVRQPPSPPPPSSPPPSPLPDHAPPDVAFRAGLLPTDHLQLRRLYLLRGAVQRAGRGARHVLLQGERAPPPCTARAARPCAHPPWAELVCAASQEDQITPYFYFFIDSVRLSS